MTNSKKTNKLSMDDIFVVSANVAPPTGIFVTATTAFNGLTNGRLGILSWDFDSAVRPLGQYKQSGDDSNEVQAIKLVVGTPVSQQSEFADPFEAGHKAYQESGAIHKTGIRAVSVKQASYATNGAQCAVFNITPEDDVEYKAIVRLKSVRNDRFYGDNDEIVSAIFPAFDFTAASLTSDLDYLLQYIANEFNSQSKAASFTGNGANRKGNKNFVVFGVAYGGSSSTVIGDIVTGDSLSFLTVDGVTSTITATESMVQMFASLIDQGALTAASTLEIIDMSTAGSASTVDTLIFVGLPHPLAVSYDEIEQVMVSVDLNLGSQFIVTPNPSAISLYKVNAKEATGTGRNWLIEWRHRAGLNVFTKQIQPHGDWFTEGKNYINEDAFYTSYIIEYFDTEDTLTTHEVSPKKVILLFPTTGATSETVTDVSGNSNLLITFTTTGSTAVAGVEANLTAWLEHVRTTGNPFKVTGDAVAGGTYLS